jgi:DNA-binding beta-propeller fold protein YncE
MPRASSRVTILALLILAGAAAGQWHERTFVVGDTLGTLGSPDAAAVNPLTGAVYLADGNEALIFDPTTLERLGVVTGGFLPLACPEQQRLYLCGQRTAIVDATADTIADWLDLPSRPTAVAWSPTSRKAYVSLNNGRLAIIDARSDSLVSRPLTAPGNLHLVNWYQPTNRLFGYDTDSGCLVAWDCAGDSVISLLRLPGRPRLFVSSPASRRIYATRDNGLLCTVDADSLALLDTITITGLDAIAHNPLTDRLYLLTPDELHVLDCPTGAIIATLVHEGAASQLITSSSTGRTYIINNEMQALTVVDTNNTIGAGIPLPPEVMAPVLLVLDPVRNRLAVVNDGICAAVIDVAADTLAGTVRWVEYDVRNLLFNPAGNKLYALDVDGHRLAAVDSAGAPLAEVTTGFGTRSAWVLNPTLNRIYVVDDDRLLVLDCNADAIIDSAPLPTVGYARLVLAGPSRLHIFASSTGSPLLRYVYDCYRGAVIDSAVQGSRIPAATYHPATSRIYYVRDNSSFIYSLDPLTGRLLDSLLVAEAHSRRGCLVADPAAPMLYYWSATPDQVYAIDLLADSVVWSAPANTDADTMYLSPASRKLYTCDRARSGWTNVYDLATGALLREITAGPNDIGVMNERNDKLWFADATVRIIDCRSDSVTATLPWQAAGARAGTWDPINNRVLFAYGSYVGVYRDDPYAVAEPPAVPGALRLSVAPNPARGPVIIHYSPPSGQLPAASYLAISDALGRTIRELALPAAATSVNWDRTDRRGRPVSPGVYFLRGPAAGATRLVLLD